MAADHRLMRYHEFALAEEGRDIRGVAVEPCIVDLCTMIEVHRSEYGRPKHWVGIWDAVKQEGIARNQLPVDLFVASRIALDHMIAMSDDELCELVGLLDSRQRDRARCGLSGDGIPSAPEAQHNASLPVAPNSGNRSESRSAPMSRADIARRLLNRPDARSRDALMIMQEYGLKKAGNKWTIRFDTGMDHNMRERMEAAQPP